MIGNWRLDPFKRVQVWVPDGPPEPDAFDETEPKPAPESSTPQRRYYKNKCVDCPTLISYQTKRCQACHFKLRKAARSRPAVTNPRGLHEPIDELKVRLVLDGTFVKCTRPERLAVLTRWSALGRTDRSLIDLTGWNVPRDRKYLETLQEMEAA